MTALGLYEKSGPPVVVAALAGPRLSIICVDVSVLAASTIQSTFSKSIKVTISARITHHEVHSRGKACYCDRRDSPRGGEPHHGGSIVVEVIVSCLQPSFRCSHVFIVWMALVLPPTACRAFQSRLLDRKNFCPPRAILFFSPRHRQNYSPELPLVRQFVLIFCRLPVSAIAQPPRLVFPIHRQNRRLIC